MSVPTENINWDLILSVAAGVAAIISALIGALVYLVYQDKKDSRNGFIKLETWFMEQQKEIHELAVSTKTAIEHSATTIEFVKEMMQASFRHQNKKR